jgi:hypothetical protein
MKIIQLKFTLPSTDTGSLYTFFKRAIPFYESPGSIRIRVLRHTLNPCQFIEVVEYGSMEAFQQDQHRVGHDTEMQGYLQEWHSLLSGEVNVDEYEDVTEEISKNGEETACKNR